MSELHRMRYLTGSGRCGYDWGPFWMMMVAPPRRKDELIEELEDYKASLEAEILALEKRIKDLKEKQEN